MKLPRLTIRCLMLAVAVVALAFWGLHVKKLRETEKWRVLDYKFKAAHNREMVQAASRFVADLEQSIASKGGDEESDPYPTLTVEQCRKHIPRYRIQAAYYQRLAKIHDHAAAHPWDPAPVEPAKPW